MDWRVLRHCFNLLTSFQVPSAVQGKRDEAEAIAQRESLVHTLLGILNNAAKFGVGPSAKDFMPTREARGYSSPSPDIGRHIHKKKEWVDFLHLKLTTCTKTSFVSIQAKLRILSNFEGKFREDGTQASRGTRRTREARGAPKISLVACPPSLARRVYFALSIISRRN